MISNHVYEIMHNISKICNWIFKNDILGCARDLQLEDSEHVVVARDVNRDIKK